MAGKVYVKTQYPFMTKPLGMLELEGNFLNNTEHEKPTVSQLASCTMVCFPSKICLLAQLLSHVWLFATPWSVHGILQARILEWVAYPFSRDLPNPGIKLGSPALQADSLPAEPQGKPKNTGVGLLSLLQGSSQPRNQTGVSCIAGGFFTNWAIRKEKPNCLTP